MTLNEDLAIEGYKSNKSEAEEIFLQSEEYQTKTLKQGTKLKELRISVHTEECLEQNPAYFDVHFQFSGFLSYREKGIYLGSITFENLLLKDFVGTKPVEI